MELKDVHVGATVIVTSHDDVAGTVLRKYRNGHVAVETDDDLFFELPEDLDAIGV